MQVQENDIDLNNTETQNLIKKYINNNDNTNLTSLQHDINASLNKFLENDKDNECDDSIQDIKSEILNDINNDEIFENIQPIELKNGIESNAEFEELNDSAQTSETEELNQQEINSSEETEELNQQEINSSEETEELNQKETNSSEETEELNQQEINSSEETEELNQKETNSSEETEELNQKETNSSEETKQNEINNEKIINLKIGQKFDTNYFVSYNKFTIYDKNDNELNSSNANIKLSFCNKNKKYCINFDNKINVYILLNKSKTIQRFTMIKKSSMFLNHFGFNNQFNDIHRIDIC